MWPFIIPFFEPAKSSQNSAMGAKECPETRVTVECRQQLLRCCSCEIPRTFHRRTNSRDVRSSRLATYRVHNRIKSNPRPRIQLKRKCFQQKLRKETMFKGQLKMKRARSDRPPQRHCAEVAASASESLRAADKGQHAHHWFPVRY